MPTSILIHFEKQELYEVAVYHLDGSLTTSCLLGLFSLRNKFSLLTTVCDSLLSISDSPETSVYFNSNLFKCKYFPTAEKQPEYI